jgi:hypothetical protein
VRLSDEAALVELSEGVRSYYLRVKDNKAAAIVSLMHVEHLYYKHDTIAVAVHRAHVFNKTWGKYSDLHPASLGERTFILIFNCKLVDILCIHFNKFSKYNFIGKISGENTNSSSEFVHPAALLGNPSVVTPTHDATAKLEVMLMMLMVVVTKHCFP